MSYTVNDEKCCACGKIVDANACRVSPVMHSKVQFFCDPVCYASARPGTEINWRNFDGYFNRVQTEDREQIQVRARQAQREAEEAEEN